MVSFESIIFPVICILVGAVVGYGIASAQVWWEDRLIEQARERAAKAQERTGNKD